nr:LysM peptidoglycan-binding domain-containing protein [Nitrospirota bacterium]
MMGRQAGRLVALAVGTVLLTGCVMAEKYEAEKARAMNFQRLLAQEEKRTGEMDSELKRLKRDSSELEAHNRELTAQVQAVREQLGRMQEDAAAMRDVALLKEQDAQGRARKGPAKGKRPDKMQPGGMDQGAMSGALAPVPMPDLAPTGGATPRYHEVRPGDTLMAISRLYGVDVNTLKLLNNMKSNTIHVGQRLVVGRQ